MKLKYGHKKTYKHELNAEQLNELTSWTGRGVGQTQFLFQLVNGDFFKLELLEKQMKRYFVGSCPTSVNAVNEILFLEDYCKEQF